ncbi:protein stoned-B [Diorhabda sublineata]|uniref:protein stoned-B n=1 Tax=Diorhabda sublineata TaxID=1163346 RepID=UPI0024E0B824|nr:protein stoned-B [Diorhabda sublineata]XP_056630241.1 protein stoned-B [Diorhabda sublineata]
MAANPFLFSEEPYVSPSTAGSNPFLLDDHDDDSGNLGDNPFLSQTATTMSTTNPFSFDPMELEPAEAEVPVIQQNNDPFDNTIQYSRTEPINNEPVLLPDTPKKPVDLDLKYTLQASPNGPPRPPPPRLPPSKETQDLLMSVMGAMDATSSSLLGKIPPTRSPSPVNMRDLHSPSPTPDPGCRDLLDVDEKPQASNQEVQNSSEADLFSLDHDTSCDINQNPAVQFDQQTCIQKESFIETKSTAHNEPMVQDQSKRLPPRPSPPVRPPKPPLPASLIQKKEQHVVPTLEDIDMFGVEEPPKKKEVSDILNLYNAPKHEPVKDLLSDLIMETEMSSQPDLISSTTETNKPVDNMNKVFSPELKENVVPSDHSQEDFQMDLSNSHSKCSISSTTLNPFAPSEDIIDQKEENNIEFEVNQNIEPNQMEITENSNNLSGVDNVQSDFFGISEPIGNNVKTIDQPNFASSAFGYNSTPLNNDLISSNEAGVISDTVTTVSNSTTNASTATYMICNATENSNTGSNIFNMSTTTNNSTTNIAEVFGKPTVTTDLFGIASTVSDSCNISTTISNTANDIFGSGISGSDTINTIAVDVFGGTTTVVDAFSKTSQNEDPFANSNNDTGDDFDDFAKKFESVKAEDSAFGNVWGNDSVNIVDSSTGFGQDDGFDAFLALQEPPEVPQSTPNKISKAASQESDEDKDFAVFIRPKGANDISGDILPTIAPPPPTVAATFGDISPRFNPFDQTEIPATIQNEIPHVEEFKRSDSQETPPTPLFDDDVSVPLEPFPRIHYEGDGWEMQLRQPNKKKITGQRFWKKIWVKLQHLPDCVLLQLYNQKDDKDPFQELPLQPCYSVSDIGAQQYDQFGKIFTVKLQYIFYKERPGVRPGQVKKAERITNKLSQFAAYAIQGDYQGVKEFGSDLKKLGLPVEHAPQVSQLMKLGSLNYEDLKQFSVCIEEALFKLQAHRDRALHYKMEEVQITAVDELYVEQEGDGHIVKQIARVRLFFLGFLTGMPDVELGVNDMRRQGKEVVGRHDIIPVVTEEWIRLEDVEFHSCIQQEDYNLTHIIKFKPPDACYIELMRFRVRPPKNRELPLQLKAQICVTGFKVELRADVLVPGFASRKLGQIPCEDVMIRFPIPECWIYLFRVEKHFRYGSVKSAHRRTGKIKGIERILGTVETLQENLIEVTSGQAKYEHQHRAIVWRCPRLPKEGQGAYTTHNMVCKIALTSYDQMPEKLAEYCYVEFTMPATQVSHTTCRSVSLQNSDSDEPPEKYVRYLARHEYRVGIEHTEGESPNAYASATYVPKPANPPPTAQAEIPKVVEESSSDSD